VSVHDIGQLTLVAYKYSLQLNPEDYLRAAGVAPRVLLRSDETATVLGLVAAGVACAILPSLVLDPDDRRISLARVDHLVPPRRIGLTWHRDRYHPAAFDGFIADARAVCAPA
jgi:DNA-binding transcriptional LysR family regulator